MRTQQFIGVLHLRVFHLTLGLYENVAFPTISAEPSSDAP